MALADHRIPYKCHSTQVQLHGIVTDQSDIPNISQA